MLRIKTSNFARDRKTIEFMSRNYVTSQVCNKQTFE